MIEDRDNGRGDVREDDRLVVSLGRARCVRTPFDCVAAVRDDETDAQGIWYVLHDQTTKEGARGELVRLKVGAKVIYVLQRRYDERTGE